MNIVFWFSHPSELQKCQYFYHEFPNFIYLSKRTLNHLGGKHKKELTTSYVCNIRINHDFGL